MLCASGPWAEKDLYHAIPAMTLDLSLHGTIQRVDPISRFFKPGALRTYSDPGPHGTMWKWFLIQKFSIHEKSIMNLCFRKLFFDFSCWRKFDSHSSRLSHRKFRIVHQRKTDRITQNVKWRSQKQVLQRFREQVEQKIVWFKKSHFYVIMMFGDVISVNC